MAVIIAIILILIGIFLMTNASSPTPSVLTSDEFIELYPEDVKNLISGSSESVDYDTIGMYNLSVRKVDNGYSGLIRGSTWNGCLSNNTPPAFGYPYAINLDDEGSVRSLLRIPLNYGDFRHCTKPYLGVYANGIEDPKLFIFNNEEWAIANCLGSFKQKHPCVNTMCLFKITDPVRTFRYLIPPDGVNQLQHQKNWSPFQYQDKLLCEYTVQPHNIIEIDINTGYTHSLFSSSDTSEIINITLGHSYRGGAPPIFISYVKNNETPEDNIIEIEEFYLGIGHTRIPNKPNYLHFFYKFSSEPPFDILKISKHFKLDKNEAIQFAAGLSLYDNIIYISYGIDDCYNRISSYSLDDIIKLLE
jgi:hypothetical protein